MTKSQYMKLAKVLSSTDATHATCYAIADLFAQIDPDNFDASLRKMFLVEARS